MFGEYPKAPATAVFADASRTAAFSRAASSGTPAKIRAGATHSITGVALLIVQRSVVRRDVVIAEQIVPDPTARARSRWVPEGLAAEAVDAYVTEIGSLFQNADYRPREKRIGGVVDPRGVRGDNGQQGGRDRQGACRSMSARMISRASWWGRPAWRECPEVTDRAGG